MKVHQATGVTHSVVVKEENDVTRIETYIEFPSFQNPDALGQTIEQQIETFMTSAVTNSLNLNV